MKSAFLSFMVLVSSSITWASEQYPAYVEKCRAAAVAKLDGEAAAQGAELDVATVQVSEIDNRALNPYKYVWFTALAHTPDNSAVQLEVLMQKPPFGKCF